MDKREVIKQQNRVRSKKRKLIVKKERPNFRKSSSDESDQEINRLVDPAPHIPEEIEQVAGRFCEVRSESSESDAVDPDGRFSDMGSEGRDLNSPAHEQTESSSVSEETSGSSEEDGDENSEIDEDEPEIKKLREWAVECKIFQVHLDKLLNILRSRLLPSLPKSSKTFLRTNDVNYAVENMEDSEGGMGSFVYFGLAKGLEECVNDKLHEDGVIELQIHSDAMPVTKSGTNSFWVILGKVHYDADIYQPFEVAIFQGQNKPKNAQEFLDRTINELNQLHENGIQIAGKHFRVVLKCIIADTPARAFLKNTLGHGGLTACERCSIFGNKIDSTTVYPSTDAEERTDDSFRNFQQPQHHHGPSPFSRLLQMINMVSFFVLDLMHLCCQGIMKKLIEYWMSGDLNFKLGARNKIELSNRLQHMRSQIPREFQRKPRAIRHYGKWKATEFRLFLLYSGPIVLKGILREQLYDHFLLFHTACRILSSKKYCLRYAKCAKHYLISFFVAMKDYYGPKSQILNAHHLIHLADDVLFMKCSLSSITAFPFENLLGKIHNQLRTAYRPLAQICRRFHEQSSLRNKKPVLPPLIEITKTSHQGEVKEFKYRQLTISASSPNNMLLLDHDIIIKVKKISRNHETPEMVHVEGVVWEKDKPVYEYPCDSTKLEMWELKKKPSERVIIRPATSITNKLMKLSIVRENGKHRFFAVGTLH